MSSLDTQLVLDRAIEALYSVFERHARPGSLAYEDALGREAPFHLAQLLERDVRGLDPGVLERYADLAVTRVGSVRDLKYFLPRLCEGVSAGTIWDLVLAQALARSELDRWPEHERVAVLEWWAAHLGHLMAHAEDSTDRAWELVCSIAWSTRHMERVVRALETPTGARHLAAAYCQPSGMLQRGLASAKDPDALQTWLLHPDRLTSMAAAFEQLDDDRDVLARGIDMYEWYVANGLPTPT